ncbi:serine protease [Tamlana sp. 2201CG12-4]|uniref:S1 family peptidase n=1 Tax=Tamlana sp. 2201CG12-4 TaxID=3112582 RepID=UPI002DBF67FD|nr:serine protease [Tamlana sp. 2201CG12-4]MEC3908838.1 serine protease [Tamlana sp. 2201CG12-4]
MLFSIDSTGQQTNTNPFIISNFIYDDSSMRNHINEQSIKMYEENNFTRFNSLISRTNIKSTSSKKSKENGSKENVFNYNESRESVLILSILYLCDKCPNFHTTIASGFLISDDGLCVSNHHVFSQNKKKESQNLAVFAFDYKGNAYPVTQVISSDKGKDLTVFRIQAKKQLTSLPLKTSNAKIGDDINVISHPFGEFYTYSSGEITRFYMNKKDKSLRASISADFARGSSGAPVINTKGEVIGVVSSTHALNAQTDNQMVVKSIIPVSELYNMIP